MSPSPHDSLSHFTSRLISRYRDLDRDNPLLLSLIYANGLLLKQQQQHTDRLPLQVAVIGPTQVGKSSLVNLLLGGVHAGVSALAGHTRHAQGFSSVPLDSRQRQSIHQLLPGLSPAEPSQLFPDRTGYYSLVETTSEDSDGNGLLVWDSPDFDSVSSRDYRSTVPALCALADLVVMVVSKEKYADQSVWELLRLIAPDARPLMLVVNKVPADSQAQLLEILTGKFNAEALSGVSLFSLPYFNDPQSDLADSDSAHALLEGFRHRLLDIHSTPDIPIAPLLHRHWQQWIEPLRQEQAAVRVWRDKVANALQTAENHFERDYLKNPDYRESLDSAILQLLQLLEVPGLAVPLSKAREIVTWPVRKAVSLFHSAAQGVEGKASMEDKLLTESLRQAHQRLLHQATIQASRSKGRQQLWWQQLWLLLQQQETPLNEQIQHRILAHQKHFQPEIQRAASRLLEHLQQHPTTLNALRATRASTDAAAVAFALKSGGIGLSDLILTPAMLAFSTLLTEGAVGQFMETVSAELQDSQHRSVREQVFLPLREQLTALQAQLPDDLLFGLDESSLQQAEQALKKLPQ
jgi:GTPase SAR1 family protein